MSIDNITAKILSDATEYANSLTSEAKSEATGILAKAKQEAEALTKQVASQAAKDAETVKQRRLSVAALEVRKMQLSVKQDAVSKAIEAAIDKLSNMQKDEYINFLVKKIAEVGIAEGQLMLNAKDKAAVGEKVVAAVNASIRGGKISLSEETINAKGGFVLKTGLKEINSTVETMINSVKEAATSEVVAALF